MSREISLTDFKSLSAAVIVLTTVAGAICAVFLTRQRWRTRLEAFAGGAFLGAGVLHLLPEALEEFDKVKGYNFLIPLCVSMTVFALFTLAEMFTMSDAAASCCETKQEQSISNYDHSSAPYDCLPESLDDPIEHTSRFGVDMSRFDVASVSFYVIVSIDSAIEGLAFGVLPRWPKVFGILCAIIAHKPIEACAVALVVLKRKPTKVGFCLLSALYAGMSPVGVAVGILLQKANSGIMLGLIESVSAGAFMFMGCREWMELFTHKYSWRTTEKLVHYGAFTSGIVWLGAVAFLQAVSQ
jgi:zinc transporter 1/2/3